MPLKQRRYCFPICNSKCQTYLEIQIVLDHGKLLLTGEIAGMLGWTEAGGTDLQGTQCSPLVALSLWHLAQMSKDEDILAAR